MMKSRIILFAVSALVIWGLFLLPKAVVENSSQLQSGANRDSTGTAPLKASPHQGVNAQTAARIKNLRARYLSGSGKEKNAIFADSLADLYPETGNFDSAVWFAEEASSFFNNKESFLKAGNIAYQGYTFAMDQEKKKAMGEKTQHFLEKVLAQDPKNLEVKTKMAMTLVTSSAPMRGIMMLREVLTQDPKNELALYSMGMLSVQSGQFDKAIDRLQQLLVINPGHVEGQLLLGVSYFNQGNKSKAKEQFQKVKQMGGDPSVQVTADSYLKDLK